MISPIIKTVVTIATIIGAANGVGTFSKLQKLSDVDERLTKLERPYRGRQGRQTPLASAQQVASHI